MKRYGHWVVISCLIVWASLLPGANANSQTITAAEAKNHIGETATVCGRVVSAHYAATSRSRPTFLNLDEPYPREVFTVVIWDKMAQESQEQSWPIKHH